MNRYLTKSKFKMALECPTKLYYTNKAEYADKKLEDSFLEALAEGGFQVGELAKWYFPGGIDIKEKGHTEPINKTNELLKNEQVTIFEAAIKYDNLFIRADVFKKNGNTIELFEVKAKSFGEDDANDFNVGKLKSNWKPYVYDVAFQKFILQKAFPKFQIRSYLLLADKTKVATVNKLNQFFKLEKRDGRTYVRTKPGLKREDLGGELLIKVNVDYILDKLFSNSDLTEYPGGNFDQWVSFLSDHFKKDEKIRPMLGRYCKDCEFKCGEEDYKKGLKSGFDECWTEALKISTNKLKAPLILDVWDLRKKQKLIDQGKYFMDDITQEDIQIKEDDTLALSRTERQWLQINKATNKDKSFYISKMGLKIEMSKWKFPLHFIDFETSAVALPFFKGMRPYESIAFQFSHHIVTSEGEIQHKGEYLNDKPGEFPNFEFIKHLKSELENDEGTIFRYHDHENTILNAIYRQLKESDEPDKNELMEWIKTVTHSTSTNKDHWESGPRDMVDLYKVVRKYYYDPATKGSISLKNVLPAVINSSKYLQDKYVKPIYGGKKGIKSLNYEEMIWAVTSDDGSFINPYDLLENPFEGISDEQLSSFMTESRIAEGGAAMAAYARMQFTEMEKLERTRLEKALLKYCELDTFSMVLIWEFFNHETGQIISSNCFKNRKGKEI